MRERKSECASCLFKARDSYPTTRRKIIMSRPGTTTTLRLRRHTLIFLYNRLVFLSQVPVARGSLESTFSKMVSTNVWSVSSSTSSPQSTEMLVSPTSSTPSYGSSTWRPLKWRHGLAPFSFIYRRSLQSPEHDRYGTASGLQRVVLRWITRIKSWLPLGRRKGSTLTFAGSILCIACFMSVVPKHHLQTCSNCSTLFSWTVLFCSLCSSSVYQPVITLRSTKIYFSTAFPQSLPLLATTMYLCGSRHKYTKSLLEIAIHTMIIGDLTHCSRPWLSAVLA